MDNSGFQQKANPLIFLREDIRTIHNKTVNEEASLDGWKRIKAREWMGILFGGLLECSEKGAVVATLGHTIIGNVPTETTQPGLPRAYYSGQSQLENPAVEAKRRHENISYVGEVSDQAERPTDENHTGGVPRHRISHSNPLVQPTARPLPHPYAPPEHPNDSRPPPLTSSYQLAISIMCPYTQWPDKRPPISSARSNPRSRSQESSGLHLGHQLQLSEFYTFGTRILPLLTLSDFFRPRLFLELFIWFTDDHYDRTFNSALRNFFMSSRQLFHPP
jgi:hypothetical protein